MFYYYYLCFKCNFGQREGEEGAVTWLAVRAVCADGLTKVGVIRKLAQAALARTRPGESELHQGSG